MLNEILVLNKNYQPINFTSLKHALIMVYNGRAEIIDFIDNAFGSYDFCSWLEVSNSLKRFSLSLSDEDKFAMPAAIKTIFYDKTYTRNLRAINKNVFIRDDYTCAYCGRRFRSDQLSVDHIIPKAKTGGRNWKNLITACIPCNARKGNRTPIEAEMPLLFNPYTPKFKIFTKEKLNSVESFKRETWAKFLDIFDKNKTASHEIFSFVVRF